ncbi:MAG: hypothetical protein ABSH14_06330 [Verrucomicrobiia bacterium]|jgi:hypothetical protein
MNAGRNVPRQPDNKLVAIARVISEQQEEATVSSETYVELSKAKS